LVAIARCVLWYYNKSSFITFIFLWRYQVPLHTSSISMPFSYEMRVTLFAIHAQWGSVPMLSSQNVSCNVSLVLLGFSKQTMKFKSSVIFYTESKTEVRILSRLQQLTVPKKCVPPQIRIELVKKSCKNNSSIVMYDLRRMQKCACVTTLNGCILKLLQIQVFRKLKIYLHILIPF